MAYKDEYEVARLYTDSTFADTIKKQFTGDITMKLQLAPPLLSRVDKESGRATKREFGPWVLKMFNGLARLKVLRGTPLDLFGYTQERRMERQLITDYKKVVTDTMDAVGKLQGSPSYSRDLNTLVEIASLPETIRGFGHVKLANAKKTSLQQAELLALIGNEKAPVQVDEITYHTLEAVTSNEVTRSAS